jgi:lipid-A-disaccharide synthase
VREIFFVAGEVSGDLHAAGVARDLVARGAPFTLVGVGGDQMRAAGVELIEHVGELAVMGFVEVLGALPKHWSLLNTLKARFRTGNVAAVVVIDYADFNMFVASAAKAAGVPVLFYITPQVWAWREGRMATLAKTVTKAAVIFPFEETLLRKHGVDATFVGHPLMDKLASMPERAEARKALGIDPDARVLALFPGSRSQEIESLLDDFVATARELQRRDPSLQVIVSAAPHVTIDPKRCPYPTVKSASFTVFRAADAALCKSGTSTLEAAVTGCPLVMAYRTNPLNFALAKMFVSIPNIALVNIVAERRVAPEFIQDAVQPKAMADALEPLLDRNSPQRRAMMSGLDAVRASLGKPGAAGRVAEMVMSIAKPEKARHAG